MQIVLCPFCRKPNPPATITCQHCGQNVPLTTNYQTYYLTKVLKSGGQGAVFIGMDLAGKTYAIKMMLEQFVDPAERAEAVARFEAEAELLQRLNHPNIPRVYACFPDDHRHYLVMDLVPGEDLAHIVERSGPLPEATVLGWADTLGKVLHFLHNQKPPIIFRDIKPSNVMMRPDGNLILIDFGIAKVLQSTKRGTQIGTPGYAPPEQYQGQATERSDVFAFCATLHHLLTGRDPQLEAPFSFPDVRSLIPHISERTALAIKRGLELNPADRFATIFDVQVALGIRQVTAPRPVAPPPQAVLPTNKPSRAKAQPVRPKGNRTQPLPPLPPQPVPQQPAASAARSAPPPPIAQPVSQAPAQAPVTPAASQPAAQPRRTSIWRHLVTFAMMVGMLFAAFQVFQIVTFTPPTVTPTPIALVRQSHQAALEVIVLGEPTDATIQEAFQSAFLRNVQTTFGEQARVENAQFAPPGPEEVSTDGRNTRYRATVTGTILVPQQP
jgi:serine/threonine-protein kinase